MNRHNNSRIFPKAVLIVVLVVTGASLFCAGSAQAQNTAFTFQGRLVVGGAPANGNYDLQFTLWDALSAGIQQPQPVPVTVTKSSVSVSGGVFNVQLDFTVNGFPGADRFLETGVKAAGGGSFTILSPRQQITYTPYAIRTLSATQADGLSNTCTACVNDAQINFISGNKVIGAIPLGSLPGGSAHYIQNTTTQQSASFNISGDGSIGGNVGIGTTSPGSPLDVRASSGLRAIQASHTATSGGNAGVFGLSASTDGKGVHGSVSAATGFNYGVYGQSSSVSGAGVSGVASATTSGSGWGGYFTSSGDTGTGVLGSALASSGVTQGVYGSSSSPSGYGGAFRNLNAGGISLAARDSAGNDAFLVRANGSVGIGVFSPAYKLDVQGGQINASGGLCINGDCKASWPSGSTGTVISVAAGTGLSASPSPITTSGTLSFDQSYGDGRYARLGAANNFTGTQTIAGGNLALPATSAAAGVITVGGTRFLHNFGVSNTFVGASAGNFTMTGFGNTVSGASALTNNSSGNFNTAVGAAALYDNTLGLHNTAIGASALLNNTTGQQNTASGSGAMVFNTEGNGNTATGAVALRHNTLGSENTATGQEALNHNSVGFSNTASGYFALYSNDTGSYNTAVGDRAGYTTTLGNGNVTGSNNTFIGYNSGPGTATQLDNATAIGANAHVSVSNALILGSGANVGIGTTAPVEALQVTADIRVGNSGSNGCLKNFSGGVIAGSCVSDLRLKKNIQAYPAVLENLVRLRPVTYDWRVEEFPEYHFGDTRSFGLIAQEVERVFPQMIAKDQRGFRMVNYSELPLLTLQAVRELKAENDKLSETLHNQQLRMNKLEAVIEALQNRFGPEFGESRH